MGTFGCHRVAWCGAGVQGKSPDAPHKPGRATSGREALPILARGGVGNLSWRDARAEPQRLLPLHFWLQELHPQQHPPVGADFCLTETGDEPWLLFQCRLVVYALLGLGSLLVGGLPLPCPPTCQCYDTSKVFCSEERMREIPTGLPGNFTQLFFLSDNLLAQVCPGAFKALGRLAELHLDGNRLEELPVGAFAGLGGLQRLQLQHNALVNLPPDIFTSLPNLTVLSLEGNRLATLPAALFTSTPHLLYLSLARNQLETLPQQLFSNLSALLPAGLLAGLPLLTTLALVHNRLARLPPEFFDANEELVHVLLANNPWACDCGLAYLLGWLQTFAEPLIHAQASCASPAALQGRSLLEVPQGQLECPGAPGVPPEEGWDGEPGENAPGQSPRLFTTPTTVISQHQALHKNWPGGIYPSSYVFPVYFKDN
uniref:Carboxypeptidase N subunit 2 n=1 Tax=Otus sunia TaxID=257818 RepID=A0A8C8ALE6_9STRI